MPIYIISFLFLLGVSYLEFYEDRINNRYLKWSVFILILLYLILLTGIRYDIGADFGSYLTIFNHVDSLSETAAYSYLEPGFKTIIIFFKSINFNPYALFLVFSSILFTFLGVGIYRINKLPLLSLFIFLMIFWIGYVMNVLRQGIAMSIFIYAIPDIKDKKITKVFFLSLLASSFHFTGLFILLSYFMYHFSLKRNTYIILTMTAIIYYLNPSVFSNIILLILPGRFQNLLISYMERFPGGVDLTSFLLRLIILGIFIYFYDELKNQKGFKGIFNIYFIGFLIYTVLSFQVQAATRINMFFRILEILLFPYLLFIRKDKSYQIIMFWMIVAIGTVLFLSDLSNSANFPYQFFWEIQ